MHVKPVSDPDVVLQGNRLLFRRAMLVNGAYHDIELILTQGNTEILAEAAKSGTLLQQRALRIQHIANQVFANTSLKTVNYNSDTKQANPADKTDEMAHIYTALISGETTAESVARRVQVPHLAPASTTPPDSKPTAAAPVSKPKPPVTAPVPLSAVSTPTPTAPPTVARVRRRAPPPPVAKPAEDSSVFERVKNALSTAWEGMTGKKQALVANKAPSPSKAASRYVAPPAQEESEEAVEVIFTPVAMPSSSAAVAAAAGNRLANWAEPILPNILPASADLRVAEEAQLVNALVKRKAESKDTALIDKYLRDIDNGQARLEKIATFLQTSK